MQKTDWDTELIVVGNGFEFLAFPISQPAEEACEETTCSYQVPAGWTAPLLLCDCKSLLLWTLLTSFTSVCEPWAERHFISHVPHPQDTQSFTFGSWKTFSFWPEKHCQSAPESHFHSQVCLGWQHFQHTQWVHEHHFHQNQHKHGYHCHLK